MERVQRLKRISRHLHPLFYFSAFQEYFVERAFAALRRVVLLRCCFCCCKDAVAVHDVDCTHTRTHHNAHT